MFTPVPVGQLRQFVGQVCQVVQSPTRNLQHFRLHRTPIFSRIFASSRTIQRNKKCVCDPTHLSPGPHSPSLSYRASLCLPYRGRNNQRSAVLGNAVSGSSRRNSRRSNSFIFDPCCGSECKAFSSSVPQHSDSLGLADPTLLALHSPLHGLCLPVFQLVSAFRQFRPSPVGPLICQSAGHMDERLVLQSKLTSSFPFLGVIRPCIR